MTDGLSRRRGQTLVPALVFIVVICLLVLTCSQVHIPHGTGLDLRPADIVESHITYHKDQPADLSLRLSNAGMATLADYLRAHPSGEVVLSYNSTFLGTIKTTDASGTNTIHLMLPVNDAMARRLVIGK